MQNLFSTIALSLRRGYGSFSERFTLPTRMELVEDGFTLVEVLIVSAITIIMMTSLIISFSGRKADVSQAAAQVAADIRNAQSNAVAAKTLSISGVNTLRCGYGIHYLDSTTYQLYAGPDAAPPTNCATTDRKYNSGGGDAIASTYKIKTPRIEFSSSFFDVFFEPPDPLTYVCATSGSCQGSYALLNASPVIITVRQTGATCPSNLCKDIYVYPSGRIEIR